MQPPIPCINLVPCVRSIFVGFNDAWNIQFVHAGTKKNSRKQFSENTESCFRQFFMIYIKAVEHRVPPRQRENSCTVILCLFYISPFHFLLYFSFLLFELILMIFYTYSGEHKSVFKVIQPRPPQVVLYFSFDNA